MNRDFTISRRGFLAVAAAVSTGAAFRTSYARSMPNVELGERPPQAPDVTVLNPLGRVPVSFVIDDSTCLVNMGYYCMPQFQEAWGHRSDRHAKPWQSWPREIPDAFVREFGEFCREQGVKGKYSIVPYPACVGWLDRVLPGWSRTELRASLKLVRDFMNPDWDIHPEMITHTRVIDIKTGRPLPQRADGGYWMENGGWDNGRSLDEITGYIAYALQLIKNLDLPCEGFTTPGGFGNGVKSILSQAAIQSIRDVCGAEVPHYFKYVVTDLNESTQPQVEHARGIAGDTPECVVNIPTCTGDYLGTWDGSTPNPTDETIESHVSEDFQSGRLVEVIRKGEPACFLTHWPGMYANGTGVAFRTFQGTVRRLNEGFRDRIRWMKLSEIARYWAAKELTAITKADGNVTLKAPFGTPGFTLELPASGSAPLVKHTAGEARLNKVDSPQRLSAGTWTEAEGAGRIIVCFDLEKGTTRISA